jgi:hypothetical protein
MAAIVGTVSYKLGGKEREFSLLSVEDLVSLTYTAPNVNGEIIDIPALDKWSKHPQGCARFLLASAKKTNPTLTLEEVNGWGSILGRSKAANDLFTRSIISGEEPEPDPKAAGQTAPVTTG